MFAIGNNELGALVDEGTLVRCKVGKIGQLEWGTDEKGNKRDMLGFITADDGKSYLVAVAGRLIPDCEVVNEI